MVIVYFIVNIFQYILKYLIYVIVLRKYMDLCCNNKYRSKNDVFSVYNNVFKFLQFFFCQLFVYVYVLCRWNYMNVLKLFFLDFLKDLLFGEGIKVGDVFGL